MAKEKRFVRVQKEQLGGVLSKDGLNGSEIWVDTMTGVNYFFHYYGNAGGLTVLLDRDGKPIISPLPITEED